LKLRRFTWTRLDGSSKIENNKMDNDQEVDASDHRVLFAVWAPAGGAASHAHGVSQCPEESQLI
jgi:hypothetical protein